MRLSNDRDPIRRSKSGMQRAWLGGRSPDLVRQAVLVIATRRFAGVAGVAGRRRELPRSTLQNLTDVPHIAELHWLPISLLAHKSTLPLNVRTKPHLEIQDIPDGLHSAGLGGRCQGSLDHGLDGLGIDYSRLGQKPGAA
jgi:hypothetical protein